MTFKREIVLGAIHHNVTSDGREASYCGVGKGTPIKLLGRQCFRSHGTHIPKVFALLLSADNFLSRQGFLKGLCRTAYLAKYILVDLRFDFRECLANKMFLDVMHDPCNLW